MQHADVAIIGGGIVGLATAYRAVHRFPGLRVVVLEKEPDVARHQTGHNSGVLHTGIYYQPGSLKAVNCRAGKAAMEAFCREEGLPYRLCGKVIVAVDEAERPALDRILERGRANGVTCERIGPERLREIEPHATGVAAIHVPEAGIVDYGQVCRRLVERVVERDGRVLTGAAVRAFRGEPGRTILETSIGDVGAAYVINCAGLHSDRIAVLSGSDPGVRIVPFRGEYFELTPEAHAFCRGLIYPVPDPGFPFLGVHFTRMIHGGVECGPNAVLAFGREGYTRTTVNWRDLAETLRYRGFRKLTARYWKTGLGEMWRSFSKDAFVRALQRLVPDLRAHHLEAAPAGIRAQAVTPDGALVDDFLIREQPRIIHVCNAPSPAATASLNIGALIVDRLASQMAGSVLPNPPSP